MSIHSSPEPHLLDRFADFLRERVPPVSSARDDDGTPETLSRREIEVLKLVKAGLTNREIAQRIVVEPGTVKRHVHNILGKLNARNRTEAVAKAHELL